MISYTFDEIYGVNIQEYCAIHKISIKTLIERVQLDLDILNTSFLMEVDREDTDYYLTKAIANKIADKQAHLRRLKRITNGINKQH